MKATLSIVLLAKGYRISENATDFCRTKPIRAGDVAASFVRRLEPARLLKPNRFHISSTSISIENI